MRSCEFAAFGLIPFATSAVDSAMHHQSSVMVQANRKIWPLHISACDFPFEHTVATEIRRADIVQPTFLFLVPNRIDRS